MIYSCIEGKNDVMIKDVADLYFSPRDKIIDLTYGKGNFWNKTNLSPFIFYKCDIKLNGIDFRSTPFKDGFFDVVVLDPPYTVRNGRYEMNDRYGLDAIDNVQQIYGLYIKGILEGRRILKKGGILMVKTQDITHGGKEYWLHDDLKKFCEIIQLWPKDLFILKNKVVTKEYKQRGSRKNHSYLWVFKKKMW